MNPGDLGREYVDGEVIVRQGDTASCCMFVVQEGQAEVVFNSKGEEVHLDFLGEGDLFGEMAIFDDMPRSATVRAIGYTRVVTIDRKNFLRRMNEDPSLAYRVAQTMSRRIRILNEELVRYKPTRR